MSVMPTFAPQSPVTLSDSLLAQFRETISPKPIVDHWALSRRPNQTPPDGDWSVWLIMAGRGFGKTRTGAEWVREQIMRLGAIRVALVAPTAADARDVMVQGESGLIACCERYGIRAHYKPSLRRVDFPNGAVAFLYSADEPERLRGPQHHCFVAGTMIATPHGERPIESLRIGDEVLTRFGTRHVIDVQCQVDTVGQVEFSNGAYLRGNAQHPVLQLDGWTIMSDLKHGDVVCTGSQLQTDTSQHIDMAGRSTSIGGFGSRQTALSPMDMRSIIETVTGRITTSRTLNWFNDRITNACMNISGQSMPVSALTVDAMSFGASAASIQFVSHAGTNGQRNGARLNAHVPFAARSLSAEKETSAVSVVSTWVADGQEPVYNLTVSTDHEYIANGIVVHNCGWGDEIAAWRRPEAWDQLQFGMRLGQHPQTIGTTTPKPVDLVRTLLKRSTDGTGDVVVSAGSTYDNAANLASSFLATIRARYEGTRLGRQEIAGELLSDVEGALWNYTQIDDTRIEAVPDGVSLARIVVAVDPPASSGADSAECGIVVAGLGNDGRGYVLDDRSVRGTPNEWANAAIKAYDDQQADCVVIEVNQGGEMATNTLRTVRQSLPIRTVHASRGKFARAEPISALYEQGRVSHVGAFSQLEDQMCTWVPDGRQPSPDRIDALVWALTELQLHPEVWGDDTSAFLRAAFGD